MQKGDLLLAADGGGSKTRLAVFDPEGHLLDSKVIGATNPNTVGQDTAVALLEEAAADLLNRHPDLRCLYFGIAGVFQTRADRFIRQRLQARFPAQKILCGPDLQNLLYTAENPGNSICVIAGTGSSVFLRQGENLVLYGGWGYLLEDGGSGYGIGRDFLRALLRTAENGRPLPDDPSGPALPFGLSREEIIGYTYGHSPADLAALAPFVLSLAQKGDPLCTEVLKDNAAHLSDAVLHAHVRHPDHSVVLLGGGLLSGSNLYEKMVRDGIGPGLEIRTAKDTPLLGACLFCAEKNGLDTGAIRPTLAAELRQAGL